MKIRIPGWLNEQKNNKIVISVNEEITQNNDVQKGYVSISRKWNQNDVVEIDFPIEVRLTEADPNVKQNQGKVPIVYCMEKAGNSNLNKEISDFSPLNFIIPKNTVFNVQYKSDLLNGVVEITGDVLYNKSDSLRIPAKFQAIPYFAWNNRGDNGVYGQNCSSQMLIWVKSIEV